MTFYMPMGFTTTKCPNFACHIWLVHYSKYNRRTRAIMTTAKWWEFGRLPLLKIIKNWNSKKRGNSNTSIWSNKRLL